MNKTWVALYGLTGVGVLMYGLYLVWPPLFYLCVGLLMVSIAISEGRREP